MSQAEKTRWVAFLPGFGELPPEVLDELAESAQLRQFDSGCQVLREGEEGDELYLILDGHAEVTIRTGEVPLALLGPAEWFGELALISGDTRRRATVTALTPLTLLALPAAAFGAVLERRPELRAGWQAAGDMLLRAKFLKEAAPFIQLPADRLRRLARGLEQRRYAAGDVIVREGEHGDECLLIQSGRAAVLAPDDGRTLAELVPGALIGEVALLSEGRRSATVVATEPLETLVLRRRDLLGAMAHDLDGDRLVWELMRHRGRLRRRPGVELHTRTTQEGEQVTILKDPARGAYFQLPAQGLYLWQHLDGGRSLRDIAVAHHAERGEFSPDLFADLLIQLARAGFIEGRSLPQPAQAAGPGPVVRGLRKVRTWLVWQFSVHGVDRLFDLLYRAGGRFWFSLAGALTAGVLGAAGVATTAVAVAAGAAPQIAGSPLWVTLLFLPAVMATTACHQLGHALAVKAYGREVPRAGFGWYWLWPIAFVDTSDSWISSVRERTAVNLSGIAANWLGGGLAVLALVWVEGGLLQLWLLQFALLSYLAALFNLHPLLEYDGYYLMMDRLDEPELRRRALFALKALFGMESGSSQGLGGRRVEFSYLFGSLVYTLLLSALVLCLYDAFAAQWWSALASPAVAGVIGWLLAGLVVVASLAGFVRELFDP